MYTFFQKNLFIDLIFHVELLAKLIQKTSYKSQSTLISEGFEVTQYARINSITYTDKSINQFVGCTWDSPSGVNKDINSTDETNDDLNYSFLSRTFASLSKIQKDKILQILNNTSKFEKVG